MSVLRSVSCFSGVSEKDLAEFAGLLEIREAGPREQVVAEGEPIDAFYIVFNGTAHVRRLAQKREVLLGRIGKGGFFGEINLFDPGMATASVYAMDKVILASIPYVTFREFMASHSDAGYAIVASLMTEVCHRLRTTNDRLVNYVYWSSLGDTTPQKA